MSRELINYIKENLAKGVPKDQIRQSLAASGWQQADIDAAFSQQEVSQSPNPPVSTVAQTQTSSLKLKEHKPFLSKEILIISIAIILILIVGGISYLLFAKKALPKVLKNLPGAETIESVTGLGELKTCDDVKAENIQEPETTLSAKFVLRETNQTSKKETFKVLDFNTKRETILNAQSPFTDEEFSPDGKYLIYKQRFESPPSLNRRDIIKFFIVNTETETTAEIIPSFPVDIIGLTNVMWSEDSKQFIIWQQDDKTRKLENGNGSHFNVDDLKANDLKGILTKFAGQNAALYQFPKQNELVFRAFKQDGENIVYEFSRAELNSGTVSNFKTFTYKAQAGVFTPDLKYYVFVEKENRIPKEFQNFQQGKSEKELEETTKKIFSEELKTYIGYVNLEENCIKKVQITEVPIFFNSRVEIKQLSKDSRQALFEIESTDISNNTTIRQYWRMDIASLTKQTKGINTVIDGDQINNIAEMSPLFNYAWVSTVKEKSYIMNLKTGNSALLSEGSSKSAIMTSWLEEK